MNTSDKQHETGFTLVELLLALAISSMLLVAVAFAFNGSIMNYRENEDIFKTINNARQALFRMTAQLRTANAVDVDPNAPSAPSNQYTFQTPGLENITYDYRNAVDKLYLVTGGNEYVLCENVTAMTFTKDTFDDGGLLNVKSVQISMTLQNGSIQKTLSAAAVVRRNLE